MATKRLVIAWTSNPGRALAIADVIGGRAHIPYPGAPGGSVLARYLASSVMTVLAVLRHRPRVVVAQNPPVIPALIGWLWIALTRGTLIIDAHPTAFGAKNNRQGRLMLPMSRWLSRRARATLVTVDDYVDLLGEWGAPGLVLHEPPVAVDAPTPADKGRAPSVFFACVFASDEPVREVVEAARSLPDVEFVVTGKVERCPVPTQELPPNVTLAGFLGLDVFLARMSTSDAVLSLTDEETSVARSAYEATYLQVPLIISDVRAMVENFTGATPCTNTPAGIAAAVRSVLAAPPTRESLMEANHKQHDRWAQQRAALLDLCLATERR